MNEIYLGSEKDQRYIKKYLANIRQLDPAEIATLPDSIALTDPRIKEVIDVDLFWKLANTCLAACQRRYSINLKQLKPDRYYTAEPPCTDTIGGFHSVYSVGYQYWYHAAFVVTLHQETVPTKELRTIELIRNFLHDCLHYSTFTSFKRVKRHIAKSPQEAKHAVPQVYREQYGINFRNQDGLSYSSRELTLCSPEAINLNLLMDGVIIRTVSSLLKETGAYNVSTTSNTETELKNEIFLEPFNPSVLPRAHNFENTVVKPSRAFIDYWGDEKLTTLVLQAMITGNLSNIHNYFNDLSGIPDAWEKKFKRPDFYLT